MYLNLNGHRQLQVVVQFLDIEVELPEHVVIGNIAKGRIITVAGAHVTGIVIRAHQHRFHDLIILVRIAAEQRQSAPPRQALIREPCQYDVRQGLAQMCLRAHFLLAQLVETLLHAACETLYVRIGRTVKRAVRRVVVIKSP